MLHDENINHFAITNKNIFTNVEREANLFALALLLDEKTEFQLNMPLVNMSNYTLKSILDYNIDDII